MKKTFKKSISVVLSLALTLACMTCAFSGFTASAEIITIPDQMLRLTGPSWGSDANPYAIIVRTEAGRSQHTYRLTMYRSPNLSVYYNCYASGAWTQFSTSFSVSNGLSSCEFTLGNLANTKLEIRFNVGGSGKTFYASDIKLVDVTSGSDTNLLNDPTVSGNFTKWSGGMLNANQQSADSDISARAALVDFDADTMGVFAPPRENTNYPENQLKFTAPVYDGGDSNPGAVMTRVSLTAGHTYRLAMFQKGLLGVRYNLYANGNNWTQYTPESVHNGSYYVYQFTPTQSYVEIRFNIGGTGKTSYVADLKLYDVTDPETNLINDPAVNGNFNNWGTHMLITGQQMGTAGGAVIYDETATDMGSRAVIEEFNGSNFDIVQFKRHSVILADNIGVNFFVSLAHLTAAERESAYMTFAITNGTEKTAAYNSEFISETGGYYGFTCALSSVQMAETVTPTLHYTVAGVEKTLVGSDYSVTDYIDYVNAHTDVFDLNVINLANAIGNYGYYAQQYFASKIFTSLDTKYRVSTYDSESYSKRKSYVSPNSITQNLSGIENGGTVGKFQYNLNLDSTTSILIKFHTANVNFTVTKGGNAYEDKVNAYTASDCTLYLLHLPVSQLGDNIMVSGTADGNLYNIQISGLTYVYGVLNNDDAKTTLKNLACALCDYYTVARAYIDDIPLDGYLSTEYI